MSGDKLNIFGHEASASTQPVLWCCEESGLDYQLERPALKRLQEWYGEMAERPGFAPIAVAGMH